MRRITSTEFGAKAPRPAYSVLRSEKGAPELPHWREGLRACLAALDAAWLARARSGNAPDGTQRARRQHGRARRAAAASRGSRTTRRARVVVPVVQQGFLDWLANDEPAASQAEEEAERLADALPARSRSPIGEADVMLAIQDALAEFAADEVVVALHREDEAPFAERVAQPSCGRASRASDRARLVDARRRLAPGYPSADARPRDRRRRLHRLAFREAARRRRRRRRRPRQADLRRQPRQPRGHRRRARRRRHRRRGRRRARRARAATPSSTSRPRRTSTARSSARRSSSTPTCSGR